MGDELASLDGAVGKEVSVPSVLPAKVHAGSDGTTARADELLLQLLHDLDPVLDVTVSDITHKHFVSDDSSCANGFTLPSLLGAETDSCQSGEES